MAGAWRMTSCRSSGTAAPHVLGRSDWLNVGKVGRDLKRQRTYAHEMTVGIDAEA